MNALCKICQHPEKDEIDRRLAGGITNKAAADKWGMSADSVRRHRMNHLSTNLHTLTGTVIDPEAVSARDRAENLFRRAETLLSAAEENGNSNLIISAMKETRAAIELLAKLSGELVAGPTVNVLNVSASPEWLATQSAMLQALSPYPEARLAVAGALQNMGN